jgi:hypothetical protein
VQDFKSFEETREAATKELTPLMNELDLGVSTEDVDKFTASHSEPMSNENLTHKRHIRHHLKPKMMTISVLPLRLLRVKKMNKAFIYLQQIMEEYDPNAERSSQTCRAVDRIQLATVSFIKRTRRLVFNFLLTIFFKKLIKTPSASTSSQH